MMHKNIEILFGHAFYRVGLDKWYGEIISMASNNLNISPIPLSINPPAKNIMWPELEHMWKKRDKKLMRFYEDIYKSSIGKEVFINYNGIAIHPDFLKELPTKNIYCCFDDPESSAILSQPVAGYYDAVFYGNIASKFQYDSWGCKSSAWLPIFLSPNDFPGEACKGDLFSKIRSNGIVFVGEKNVLKENRLNELMTHFPKAVCYGRSGWEKSEISREEKDLLYKNSKIGWNIHNSTGPINIRLFQLAAYGIMQICDNKTGLGQIFNLNEEAVGFDTIPEAIELTDFYLNHEELREEIAKNGYARFWNEYHPTLVWKRIEKQINDWGLVQDEIEIGSPIEVYSSSWKNPIKQNKLKICIKESKAILRTFNHKVKNKLKKIEAVKIFQPQFSDEFYLGKRVQAYIENPEAGAVNLAELRKNTGLPLEWPNIVALNWAVTSLINNAINIVEIGSGTGAFGFYASVDNSRHITCFENDDFARNFAIARCKVSNIKFYKSYRGVLKNNYDLLVSIEVIEHIDKVHSYLKFCQKLSKRAIFTTPNRLIISEENLSGPPNYIYHVREYTPGEFYWLLKEYYSEVYLYHMPDVFVPWIQPMSISTKGTPIIAECINQ